MNSTFFRAWIDLFGVGQVDDLLPADAEPDLDAGSSGSELLDHGIGVAGAGRSHLVLVTADDVFFISSVIGISRMKSSMSPVSGSTQLIMLPGRSMLPVNPQQADNGAQGLAAVGLPL